MWGGGCGSEKRKSKKRAQTKMSVTTVGDVVNIKMGGVGLGWEGGWLGERNLASWMETKAWSRHALAHKHVRTYAHQDSPDTGTHHSNGFLRAI